MWYIIIFIAVLAVDQGTKTLVAFFAKSGETAFTGTKHIADLIPNFIEFDYCENKNGMMGLFYKLPYKDVIFIVATVLILIAMVVYLFASKNRGKWLNVTLALIFSGAIGNFIDRIFFGYVRDFIHAIISFGGKEYFPYIFNVADMALVIGAIMLIVYILFIDKDAIFKKKKAITSDDGEISNGDSEDKSGK